MALGLAKFTETCSYFHIFHFDWSGRYGNKSGPSLSSQRANKSKHMCLQQLLFSCSVI